MTDADSIQELLDFKRCAALHNSIVELSWTQRGLNLEALEKRTWWEEYGGDEALASTAERLDSSVVSFLKTAWNGGPRHELHRYVSCLCPPDRLFENAMFDDDEDSEDKTRYVTLYCSSENGNFCSGHPFGTVLDQCYGEVMHIRTIEDSDIAENGRVTWLPLEVLLEGWLGMIKEGKIVAIDEKSYDGEQEANGPWIMPSFTQLDLDDTLRAFQRLVDVIHSRMPIQPQTTGTGLLDIVTGGLLRSLLPNSFAHRFLSEAPCPAFKNIAPGLQIAQRQPFDQVFEKPKRRPSWDTNPDDEFHTHFPLLLFSSTQLAHVDTHTTPWGEEAVDFPFDHEFNEVSTYPAGLYLTEIYPQSFSPWEDGCKLILPFTLGANAFARTSDGLLIGEDKTERGEESPTPDRPSSCQLYQSGYNPFGVEHDVQLKYVLWKWVEMVEQGKWKVDADGVVGGIEKWKEADTEEHWEDYYLPMNC